MSRYENELIKRLLDKAEFIRFAGKNIYAVNSPVLHSQIGARLAKKAPLGIVWHQQKGRRFFSLRSRSLDVSKIAEKFGGGGHRLAAGFNLSASKPLPWKNGKIKGGIKK